MQFLKKFVFLLTVFCLISCDSEDKNVIKFGISADYPPFAFYENSKISGFEIDLASKIAEILSKKVVFEDMQFSNITLAVSNNKVDAGIAAITSTKERELNFDFSNPYYKSEMTLIFFADQAITNKEELNGKKVACQLGTTMEMWLKNNAKDCIIISMDTASQAIEALKAYHVDAVFLDGAQAVEYQKNNKGLQILPIAFSIDGYRILLKKNSPLKNDINNAIEKLEASGEIEKLQNKWFKSSQGF